jgi:DNA-binding CsgD family transcriptional regulator
MAARPSSILGCGNVRIGEPSVADPLSTASATDWRQLTMQSGPTPWEPILHPPLTDRERDVIRLVGRGLDVQSIADELGLSLQTIRTYEKRLHAKVGAQTRAHLAIYALRSGLA